mgnify:CR=1 FL=1
MTAGDAGAVVQGDSDTIALVPNYANPGTLDLAQASGTAQPIYNNGAVFDGTNDFLAAAFTANTGPANATLVYIVKSSDTAFMLGGSNSTTYYSGIAESGSGSSASSNMGTPSYRVDGQDVPSEFSARSFLYLGWGTGSAVVAAIVGADYENAAITDIRNYWGSNNTYAGNGTFCLVAILDGSDPDHANALALAETLASEQITALGL